MKCSEAGLSLIKEFEGCELEAYPDPATGEEPWTIGYGHTSGVKKGQVINEEQATEFLRHDIEKAERCIANSVVGAITQGQFDALCSFIFNLGCGAFGKSTLLKCLNNGEDLAAAQEFPRWNRANGRVMAGLTRRRMAEMEMFLR